MRGRHLRAGARYTVTSDPAPPVTTTVRIREWRRSTAIALEQRLTSADVTGRVALRPRTPEAAAWWNATLAAP
ncbi:hypothetical protein ACWD04_02830 [Streptomyces sp. NPDC002911]